LFPPATLSSLFPDTFPYTIPFPPLLRVVSDMGLAYPFSLALLSSEESTFPHHCSIPLPKIGGFFESREAPPACFGTTLTGDHSDSPPATPPICDLKRYFPSTVRTILFLFPTKDTATFFEPPDFSHLIFLILLKVSPRAHLWACFLFHSCPFVRVGGGDIKIVVTPLSQLSILSLPPWSWAFFPLLEKRRGETIHFQSAVFIPFFAPHSRLPPSVLSPQYSYFQPSLLASPLEVGELRRSCS